MLYNYKLYVLRIVSWSYNCLLRIIISYHIIAWNTIIVPKLLLFYWNSWNYAIYANKWLLLLNSNCYLKPYKVSKVGDLSRGWLEGSLFDSYYTKV